MFDANWTWSHFIDDAPDPGTTLNEMNLYDLGAEKASSSFDHRHRVVASSSTRSVWLARISHTTH